MFTLRGYITQEQANDFTGKSVPLDKISLAEAMIDAYAGAKRKFFRREQTGVATGGSTTTLEDSSSNTPLTVDNNFYKGLVVQMLSGDNEGEIRSIEEQEIHQLTFHTAFSNAIKEGDAYLIYQIAKYPTFEDYYVLQNFYFKIIPNQIKQATLEQVNYIMTMPDSFFAHIQSKESETIGDYSYKYKNVRKDIAPKAKTALKGLRNIKGYLLA